MPKAGSALRLDGDGKPIWVLLELTYQCPLKCVFCSNPVDFDRGRDKELSTDEWKRVIHDARQMGAMQIGFSGVNPRCARISRRWWRRPTGWATTPT